MDKNTKAKMELVNLVALGVILFCGAGYMLFRIMEIVRYP